MSIDEAAATEVHQRAVIVDTHNDLLMLAARRPAAHQATYFRRVWLPQLEAGGVAVQVLPVCITDEYRPEGALRETLRMIEAGWRIARGNSDRVWMCTSGAAVHESVAAGKVALILALEGCEAIGTDVGLLETMHRLGVRIASLTHLGRTQLADGSAEDDTGSRLTAAGVDAVATCEDVGIMIDLSHLGARCVDHLLEIATRPVIATHSSAYSVTPHHRNLTDERIQAIAESGGTVGVNFLAKFVTPDPKRATVGAIAEHMEHIAGLVGVDHLGIGPDFIQEVHDGLTRPELYEWSCEARRDYVAGLEGPSGLPLLTAELLRRGWTSADVSAALGSSALDVLVAGVR